jgi:hypothetical protein
MMKNKPRSSLPPLFISIGIIFATYFTINGCMEFFQYKPAPGISAEARREFVATAWIKTIGENSITLSTSVVFIALALTYVSQVWKSWYSRLIPAAGLLSMFAASGYLFALTEQIMEILPQGVRTDLTDQILACKVAALVCGLVTGGTFYDCLKGLTYDPEHDDPVKAPTLDIQEILKEVSEEKKIPSS